MFYRMVSNMSLEPSNANIFKIPIKFLKIKIQLQLFHCQYQLVYPKVQHPPLSDRAYRVNDYIDKLNTYYRKFEVDQSMGYVLMGYFIIYIVLWSVIHFNILFNYIFLEKVYLIS